MSDNFENIENDIEYSLVKYYKFSKMMLIAQFISLLLFILILPIFVYLVLSFIWSIKTLCLKTYNDQLNKEAILWGLLGLFFLGLISTFVFNNRIKNTYPNINDKSVNINK